MDFRHDQDTIIVGENLKEIKEHGDFEYPVGIYDVNLKNMYMEMVRWHWHDEVEFIYVEEGSGIFCISEETYKLSAKEGLFINKGVLHSVQMSVEAKDDNCLYTSIVVHPSFIFGYGQTKLASMYLNPILTNPSMAAMPLKSETVYDTIILELLRRIIRLNREQPFCRELYTKDHLIRIWILMLESRQKEFEAISEPAEHRVNMDEVRAKEAIRYIEEHYTEPISLEDIAASIHVSKSECCRCIKRCMKMTPFEYLMKHRIYVAAGILCDRNCNDSIAEVASKVGFNSSSYFNKLFRKYLKCTPSQYKARQLSGS